MTTLNCTLNTNPLSWSNNIKKAVSPITRIIAGGAGIVMAIAKPLLGSTSWGRTSAVILGAYSLYGGANDLTKHLSPMEALPSKFWEELEASNQRNADAPLALLELTEADPHGAYSDLAAQAEMLQIAKNQRLAIRTAKKVDEVGQNLRDVQQEHGAVNSLYIGAHGNPTKMRLGNIPILPPSLSWDQDQSVYTFDEDHYKCLHDFTGKKIFLDSCKTGLGLAPKIAKKTKKDVWGSLTSMSANTTMSYPCHTHHLDFSYYSNDEGEWADREGQLDMRIFHPASPPTIPCQDAEATKAAFFERINYYKQKIIDLIKTNSTYSRLSELCDLYYFLGKLNLKACEILHLSNTELTQAKDVAEKCFESLIVLHNSSGSYELGRMCFKSGRFQDGFDYIKNAADRGHPGARCYLGHLYENGLGVQKNIAKAKMYYQLARKSGHKEATFRLGLIYKDEGKLYEPYNLDNPETAYQCFLKAYNNGHARASYELGLIYAHKFKDYKEAIDHFNAFNLVFKGVYHIDHAPSQLELAKIYIVERKRGDAEKALVAADQVLGGNQLSHLLSEIRSEYPNDIICLVKKTIFHQIYPKLLSDYESRLLTPDECLKKVNDLLEDLIPYLIEQEFPITEPRDECITNLRELRADLLKQTAPNGKFNIISSLLAVELISNLGLMAGLACVGAGVGLAKLYNWGKHYFPRSSWLNQGVSLRNTIAGISTAAVCGACLGPVVGCPAIAMGVGAAIASSGGLYLTRPASEDLVRSWIDNPQKTAKDITDALKCGPISNTCLTEAVKKVLALSNGDTNFSVQLSYKEKLKALLSADTYTHTIALDACSQALIYAAQQSDTGLIATAFQHISNTFRQSIANLPESQKQAKTAELSIQVQNSMRAAIQHAHNTATVACLIAECQKSINVSLSDEDRMMAIRKLGPADSALIEELAKSLSTKDRVQLLLNAVHPETRREIPVILALKRSGKIDEGMFFYPNRNQIIEKAQQRLQVNDRIGEPLPTEVIDALKN